MSEKKAALPEYHQSSIGMFLKCPRQYMYRYLMGLVLPPKSALTLGRAIDKGAGYNFEQKIASRTDLPIDDVLDAYSTTFDKEAPQTDWEGEDAGKVKDHGAKMLKVFHEQAAPKIQPVTIQEGFRLETDQGYALGGTFDVVDESENIRDTKTSKANYEDDAVANSIQATMYDFAFEATRGKKPKAFIFDVVTKHKEPRYQEVSGQVSDNQRNILFESVKIMHAQIERGEFQYAPEGAWWCSKQWCGYWHLCKGKK